MENSDVLCTQYICLETLVLNDRGSSYCLGHAKRSACLQRNISRLRTRLAITLLIVLASFFLAHTTSAAVNCVSTAAELQQILRDTRGDSVADEILIAEGVYSDTRTDGGGVYLLNVDSATFKTNTVEDNTSEGEGGGIYVEDNMAP